VQQPLLVPVVVLVLVLAKEGFGKSLPQLLLLVAQAAKTLQSLLVPLVVVVFLEPQLQQGLVGVRLCPATPPQGLAASEDSTVLLLGLYHGC
jgi:hypothetical protein